MSTTSNHAADDVLIYRGICAVAAHCDGAVTEDGVGFNGQDSKFGRRIAAIPFEDWTDEIKAEAARLAKIYRDQILRYISVDMSSLPTVRSASDETNYAARSQARAAAYKQQNMVEVKDRRITVEGETYSITWSRKDPDFNDLLDSVRALPGRKWSGQVWTCPVSRELAEFAKRWEFIVSGAAKISLRAISQAPAVKVFNVRLDGGHAIISAPYDAHRVPEARSLPGRSWDGERKVDVVDITPELLVFARRWSLSVAPEVEAAVGREKTEVVNPMPELLTQASRCGDPAKLDPRFIALVREKLAANS